MSDLELAWTVHGLSVVALDLELLRGISGFFVLLIPITLCLGFCGYLFYQYREQKKIVWKSAVAVLALILIICFFVMLKYQVKIPDDYIPTRWSDFSFWSGLWKDKQEAVRLLLQIPKTDLDYGWMTAFARTIGCGVLAEILFVINFKINGHQMKYETR